MNKNTKYEDVVSSQEEYKDGLSLERDLLTFEENFLKSVFGTILYNAQNVTFPQFKVELGKFATVVPTLEDGKYVMHTAGTGLTPPARITCDIDNCNEMNLQNKCTFNITDLLVKDAQPSHRLHVAANSGSGKVTCTDQSDSSDSDFDSSNSVRSFVYAVNKSNDINLDINDIKSKFEPASGGKKAYCAIEVLNKHCNEITYMGSAKSGTYYYQDKNVNAPTKDGNPNDLSYKAVTIRDATDVDISYCPVKSIDFICGGTTPVGFGYEMLKLFGDSFSVSLESADNLHTNYTFTGDDKNRIDFSLKDFDLSSFFPNPRGTLGDLVTQIPLVIGNGEGSCGDETCSPNSPFALNNFFGQTGKYTLTPLCMEDAHGDYFLFTILNDVGVNVSAN